MYKPQKAKKVFFSAITFSLIVVVLYCYVFIKILQENERVAGLNNSIETLTKDKDAIILLKKKVSETEVSRNKINNYFIPVDGMVSFLNELQSIGRENNLDTKINSVSVTSDTKIATSTYETANVTVEVAGLWSDVYRFVTLVELMPFGVSVNGVDLERTVETILSTASKNKNSAKVLLWRGTMDVNVLKLK